MRLVQRIGAQKGERCGARETTRETVGSWQALLGGKREVCEDVTSRGGMRGLSGRNMAFEQRLVVVFIKSEIEQRKH